MCLHPEAVWQFVCLLDFPLVFTLYCDQIFPSTYTVSTLTCSTPEDVVHKCRRIPRPYSSSELRRIRPVARVKRAAHGAFAQLFPGPRITVIVVQLPSHVWLFATPWAARQASPFLRISRSPPKFMSLESVTPSNHLILRCPLLRNSLPQIPERFSPLHLGLVQTPLACPLPMASYHSHLPPFT